MSERVRYESRIGQLSRVKLAVRGRPMTISPVPEGHMSIRTGLSDSRPSCLLVYPLAHDGETVAVLQLAGVAEFDEIHLRFLKQISNSVAQEILGARSHRQVRELLARTQQQTETLRKQQGELEEANR